MSSSSPKRGSEVSFSGIRNSKFEAKPSAPLAAPAFTLLELLVAVTMIVAILSMVYGSYFATSRSAQACEAKIVLSRNARNVLEQIARQIRCAYAPALLDATGAAWVSIPPVKKSPDEGKLNSRAEKLIGENTAYYFYADQQDPSGEILHLVTTHPLLWQADSANGLFNVTYKLDKIRGLICFSQERFIGIPQRFAQERGWQTLLANIGSIELAFFDGQQWLHQWDYEEKRELPHAVDIKISCADQNGRRCCYRTIVRVCCQNNQSKRLLSDTLVSLSK